MLRRHPDFWWMSALVLLVGHAGPAASQIPDEFENLQVLDEKIPKGELMGIMRNFCFALDFRCSTCHVGDDAQGFGSFDWKSDDKPQKRTARLMMQMTRDVNQQYVAKASGEAQPVEVRCVTCHRGQAKPVLIQDAIAEAHAEGGIAGAKARYDELREKYYGRHTYDFGEMVLPGLAETFAGSAQLDDAAEILEMNLIHHPESTYTMMMLANVYRELGDKETAIARLEAAAKIEPDNPRIQRSLETLKQE